MRWFAFTILLVLFASAPAFALSDKSYITLAQFDGIALLPPPPAADSVLQKQDLAAVLAAQKTRTPALIKRAQTDRDFFGFATVFGPKFTPENIPVAASFIRKVTAETGAMVDRVQNCWQRPRPFIVSQDVQPADNAGQNMMAQPGMMMSNAAPHGAGAPCKPAEKSPGASYSYPSNAANAAMTAAILLADMVPEKREALFARAWEFGENRVILGVHFPSDIEAGRMIASAMIAVMMQNPEFKTDLAAARAEARAVLGLP
jgi:acid phosphatase (class A)